ncbi:MAG: hypothetical protein L0Y44_14225 [Phycisphaerales bacterium]|nr:hypothetical protein [Phycisphaerales bacterium]MCI0631799.1 hypothetical protein [Phycisphaerales bacterium]MCI0676396.1 hypothetical protein [Phycisphaerales bacterium]
MTNRRNATGPFQAASAAACAAIILSGLGMSPCAAVAADCDLEWDVDIGQPGLNARVSAMTVFDDGSGPALIVGGEFTNAGGVPVSRVAKWTGTSWQPFGTNLPFASVLALAVFDDGNGPKLYAGGSGASPTLVRWTGSQWQGVPNAPNSWIGELAVYDAGDGPELYVSGAFVFFPTVDGPTDYIARWNGQVWRSVGDGLVGVVQEFAPFDDGSGPALFAVGAFGFFGSGASTIGFGKFDGQAWSGAGGGFDGGAVYALKLHDDGSGPALYAGGDFHVAGGTSIPAGGIAASRIARWNGQQWSTLSSGMNHAVNALMVFDEDGDGSNPPALFAAGDFTIAGGQPASRIAKWNGTSWSALGGGLDGSARIMALSPDAQSLYVGGDFTIADSQPAGRIASLHCPDQAVPGDVDGDGDVDIDDLLAVITAWGFCINCELIACPADVNEDCFVDIGDLLFVISHWG